MRLKVIQELIDVAKQSSPDMNALDIKALDKEIGFNDYLIELGTISKSSSNKDDEKFSDAKRVLHALSDRILLINSGFPSSQALGIKYYECLKMMMVSEILNSLLMKRAALFAAEYVQKKAMKYYFLHLVFLSSRIIYTRKTREGNTIDEKRAVQIFKQYLDYYKIERDIEIDRNEILRYYKSSQSTSALITQMCESAISRYKSYENNIPSFYFHNYFYFLKHIKFTNTKNHLAVYNNAETALEYFENLPFDYVPGRLTYLYVVIIFQIQKEQYLKAARTIEKALLLVRNKSGHWFAIKENEILLNFHRGTYSRTCGIFYDQYLSKEFKDLQKIEQQRWHLYEVYVRILLEAGLAEYKGRKKQYNVHKFLNDLPRFSNDKRAMNIPILIAQMIFLIIRRKHDQATDRITALEKYSKRYLKKNDDTFRSNCFIKMLLEVPKQGFNKIAIERHAKKYFDRLKSSEIELIDQPFEIEIIPYERLWEIIMDNLSRKKRYAVGGGK